jgi:hypothetical protein
MARQSSLSSFRLCLTAINLYVIKEKHIHISHQSLEQLPPIEVTVNNCAIGHTMINNGIDCWVIINFDITIGNLTFKAFLGSTLTSLA